MQWTPADVASQAQAAIDAAAAAATARIEAAEQRFLTEAAGLLVQLEEQAAKLQFGAGVLFLGVTSLLEDVVLVEPTAAELHDITGETSSLSFSVEPDITYQFRFFLIYGISPDLNTGTLWSINGPTASLVNFRTEYTDTLGTRNFGDGRESYDSVSYGGTTGSSTGCTAIIEGLVRPTEAGTVVGRMGIGGTGYTLTVKKGSYVEYGAIA